MSSLRCTLFLSGIPYASYRYRSYYKKTHNSHYYRPKPYHDYHEPKSAPSGYQYAAPSYFKVGIHSPVMPPKHYPESGYGYAPSEIGGHASPSYFVSVGGGYNGVPTGGDPDPWYQGGGHHSPSSYGYGHGPTHYGGWASPSYFSGGYHDETPSYGNPDPWGSSPSSHWNSPSSYNGAPQSFGNEPTRDSSNIRHKIGDDQDTGVNEPVPIPSAVPIPATAAPVTQTPSTIDFRIPGMPAIAPSSPFAYMPSAGVTSSTTTDGGEATTTAVDVLCNQEYDAFGLCINSNSDACTQCNPAPPDLEVGVDCEAYTTWSDGNFECCTDDVCGEELKALDSCKECLGGEVRTSSL